MTSISTLVRLDAVVRVAMLDRVLHALRDAGAQRLTVLRAHAVGAGADPRQARLSVEEGGSYADVAVVQVVCDPTAADRLVSAACAAARTGRQGDGIITISPVLSITKIRTGVTGLEALT